MEKFLNINVIESVRNKFKELGFLYVILDLDGYRMGSMNLSLNL